MKSIRGYLKGSTLILGSILMLIKCEEVQIVLPLKPDADSSLVLRILNVFNMFPPSRFDGDFSEEVAYRVEHMFSTEGDVASSFNKVDISTDFKKRTSLIPTYDDYSSGVEEWFPINYELLDEYHETYGTEIDSNYYWFLYYVDGYELNHLGGIFNLNAMGLASLMDRGINNSPSVGKRYSFVFVEDILTAYEGFEDDQGLWILKTTIHELGHQRAGLTDNDNPFFYEYHPIENRVCVMDYYSPKDSLKFCDYIENEETQETHCREVFSENVSVY